MLQKKSRGEAVLSSFAHWRISTLFRPFVVTKRVVISQPPINGFWRIFNQLLRNSMIIHFTSIYTKIMVNPKMMPNSFVHLYCKLGHVFDSIDIIWKIFFLWIKRKMNIVKSINLKEKGKPVVFIWYVPPLS